MSTRRKKAKKPARSVCNELLDLTFCEDELRALPVSALKLAHEWSERIVALIEREMETRASGHRWGFLMDGYEVCACGCKGTRKAPTRGRKPAEAKHVSGLSGGNVIPFRPRA